MKKKEKTETVLKKPSQKTQVKPPTRRFINDTHRISLSDDPPSPSQLLLPVVVLVGHRMLLYDERTTTRSIDDDYSQATLIIKV